MRPPSSLRSGLVHMLAAFGLAIGSGTAGAADPADVFALPRAALEVACKELTANGGSLTAPPFARRFEGADIAENPAEPLRGGAMTRTLTIALPDGGRLSLEAIRRGDRLLRLAIELWAAGESPRALLLAGPDCRPAQGRLIRRDADGIARSLAILGADLTGVRAEEPLNPPVPSGRDADGVTVAVIDSGIAYDRPDIARRLARDAAGALIGADFWERDGLPYDHDAGASPFVARRHGTLVADILIRVAGPVRLIPVRYPRPDMARFADLVAFIARHEAHIATLAMGSDDPADWRTFADAARAHPDILFVVSAGNNGRNIDAEPVYPAAFDLDNLLVVTSVTETGRIARGSNWGAESVDIGVPAERLVARDPVGRERPVAGSSFAVPLAAGLAARLKGEHPDWNAARIKRAILDRVRPLPTPVEGGRLAHGWIDLVPEDP